MNLVRLTKENANNYIGCEILFKTKGEHIVKKILSVNNNGIKIDYQNLQNQLNFNRKIFVLNL
tara:strand:+ start:517 stop:705 length:189 start_codon:yes stop_codon:yes gene_type:complete